MLGLGLPVALAASAGVWMWSSQWVKAPANQPALPAHAPAAPARARPAPPPGPPQLQQALSKLATRWNEPVGIAVSEVGKSWVAAVNGEGVFPQQSVSKTWVALTVMDAVDHGRLHLSDPILMRLEDRSVFYQPIARKIGRKGYETSVGELLERAIIDSDNAANDRLLRLVGGAEVVKATMRAKGLEGIRIGAPEHELQAWIAGMTWRPELAGWKFKEARATLPDAVRDAAEARYLANPPDGAEPAAVAQALAALRAGKLLSASSTEKLLDIMSQVRTGRSRLKAGLPRGWSIAHKTGTGPDWRGGSVGINDVALLTAPDGKTYSVAVMIRRTVKPNSARRAFMQQVARAVVQAWDAERHNQA
jgi:beta-lactamase class A